MDTSQRAAAIIGMGILSAFLLGLAESIGKVPFWGIVIIVLSMAWYGVYEECFKKQKDQS